MNRESASVKPDSAESAAEEIEVFIRDHFHIPLGDAAFSRRVNLWEEGYVDSLGVVEVIEFLEHRFAIKLPQEVIFSPDFTSIDNMARCVIGLKVD